MSINHVYNSIYHVLGTFQCSKHCWASPYCISIAFFPAPLGRHAIFSIAQMQNLRLNCSGIKSSTVKFYTYNFFVKGMQKFSSLPTQLRSIHFRISEVNEEGRNSYLNLSLLLPILPKVQHDYENTSFVLQHLRQQSIQR